MNTSERISLIAKACAAAVTGAADVVVEAMFEIGRNSTVAEMFDVCCAIASVAKEAAVSLLGEVGPDKLWTLSATHLDAAEDDPYAMFAMRFIVAYCNDDIPTCEALFLATLEAPEGSDHPKSIMELLLRTSDLIRAASAQPAPCFCGKVHSDGAS